MAPACAQVLFVSYMLFLSNIFIEKRRTCLQGRLVRDMLSNKVQNVLTVPFSVLIKSLRGEFKGKNRWEELGNEDYLQ